MKRRFLSLLLGALLILPLLLPCVSAAQDAAQELSPSETCVEWIKQFEGFSATAYYDAGGWYIGYGVACGENEYPYGISEAEADAQLRTHLQEICQTLNLWLNNRSISLTQYQFDALASFTYNVGVAWLWSDSKLEAVILEGVGTEDPARVVHAFGVWCHEDSGVSKALVRRRIAEACVYLYGDYEGVYTENFVYLALDAAGGSVENDMVFYERGKPYGTLPVAELEGNTFYGWQTETGEVLSAQMVATQNLSVSALWTDKVDPAWENPYTDVTEEDWFYPYVSALSQEEVIHGYPDGTFRPLEETTLGEALTLILLSCGYGVQQPTTDHWASGYLQFAQMFGMIEPGITDLDAPVSRLTVARIAARALGLADAEGVSPFADTEDGAVLALYRAGIVSGSYVGGTLVYQPESSIIRAEISTIIWQIRNSSLVRY